MKKRTGRPRFAPTDAQKLQVVTLAANGFPDQWIADHLGINGKTLTKYFCDELRVSKKVAAAKLKLTIYRRGMEGELVAALAWLNNHGWGHDASEGELLPPPALGISFESGGPARVRKVAYDLENDPNLRLAPGADRLFAPGDEVVKAPARITAPEPVTMTAAEFDVVARNNPAPSPPPPASTSLATWERLGLSAQEFAQLHPDQETDWGQLQARLRRMGR